MKKSNMMILTAIMTAFLTINLASAHGAEDFAAAEELIDQKVACEDLTDDQLELLGDYYMEQMHPGEQHEFMDEMMGGEGSESLRQMHINMALSFYCGEHGAMSGGMMNTMMGQDLQFQGQQYPEGMMEQSQQSGDLYLFLWLAFALVAIVVIVLIAVLATQRKNRKR